MKHNTLEIQDFGLATNSHELDPAFTKKTAPFVVQEHSADYDDPVIHFVNNIIHEAIQKSASDIHFEPYDNFCRIRFRQDGLLYEITQVPVNLSLRVVTRLKVMANLDISERRLPQDGRFQLNLTSRNHIDIRVNTCPTLFGEKVVLRLLDERKVSLPLDALGMSATQKALFLEKISQPQGMILVTGPTGSGKTVTLYAALRHLNTTEKNISTVEDPIEIQLAGINQVNINPKIGLDFASVLRTFLRQDPDIIMIGEIRDKATAEIAIQASQTGHLVLSTVHTNSAIDTLTRLQAMGISAYDLASSVTLIIAQRLVRLVCPHCKTGCEKCHEGYRGRLGVYEFLPITQKIEQQLHAGLSQGKPFILEDFRTLRHEAMDRLNEGLTTLTEINRVMTQRNSHENS